MANEKITIKMVSEKAKVSKTTVSRYLNGKYEFMSVETRKRIEEVIKELDYHPNAMAQSLKNNKTGLIGLVIADITNPFSARLLKGVNDICTGKSFQVIMIDTNNDLEKERESIQSLIHRQVEGMIINTVGNNDDFIHARQQQGIKIVLAGKALQNHHIDTVTADHEKATVEMIKKVYNEGFECVGFFSQSLDQESRRKKYDYFIETSKHFVKYTSRLTYLITENNAALKECKELVQAFLDAHKGIHLALFAESSFVIVNLIYAVYSLGLRIPEDVGVCGYDELGLTHIIHDGISIVSKPTYTIGVEATELLLKRIAKGKDQYKPKLIEIPSEVTLKNSTRITDNTFDRIVIKLNQAHKPFIKEFEKKHEKN